MLAIYKLLFKLYLTVGDHSGYCSGEDCEDRDEEMHDVKDIGLSESNYKFFNYLIRVLSPQKLNLSLTMYRLFHFDASHLCDGGGSNYCGASPSGLQHDYRLNSYILQQIKFSKFVSHHERLENPILNDKLNHLKRTIYNVLFTLKRYRVVKDMRVLIINKFLNKK